MTLPHSTTTVAVIEPDGGDDTTAPGTGATIASGIPAVFSAPSGIEQGAERVDGKFFTDPIPALTHRHIVFDETTFDRWSVVWVQQRVGLGQDHTVAGVNRIAGAA